MAGKGRSPAARQLQTQARAAPRRPHAVRIPAAAFPTDVERIEFAVRFVQTDLDGLNSSDWARLREEFERLRWPSRSAARRAGPAQVVVPHAPWVDPERELPERIVRKLQRETTQLVTDIVDAGEGVQRRQLAPPTSHRLVFRAFPLVFPDRIVRQVEGRPRDLFLHLLFSSFEHEPPDRVRRCPECRKLFVRRRKQVYCSERCNNRVTARKWRGKESVKEERRTKARDKYAEQIQENLGGNVVVGRDGKRLAGPRSGATGKSRQR